MLHNTEPGETPAMTTLIMTWLSLYIVSSTVHMTQILPQYLYGRL